MPKSRRNKRSKAAVVDAEPTPLSIFQRPRLHALLLAALYASIAIAVLGIGAWSLPMLAIAATLAGLLIGASVVDIRQLRLPDWINAAILLLGLATAALGGLAAVGWSAAAATAGFALLWLVGEVYHLVRGIRGIGLGDAKLLGAGLAHVGIGALPSVVLIAAAAALLAVAVVRLAGTRVAWHDRIAFGPFLALAIWIVWIGGPLV